MRKTWKRGDQLAAELRDPQIQLHEAQLSDLFDAARILLSESLPSEWAEARRVLDSGDSPWPGKFSYKNSPYTREIVNRLSPNDPAKIVAVMKGSQIGFTASVIENGIVWIISEAPGNILLMTGHEELSEKGMMRIDKAINSSGIRHLIQPSVVRRRNATTGDTKKAKEFPGGSLSTGSASNHKLLRQQSIQYCFIDDFDSVKKQTKQSGNTTTLIEQRLAAYYLKMKLFLISTPELEDDSNIEPAFKKGDQRYYKVPCPCCGVPIILEWETKVKGTDHRAGITWTEKNGRLVEDSVGYVCQECGDFFTERHKTVIIENGFWEATAEPSEPGYYSYHISSLYANDRMYDWTHYVRKYMEACPADGVRKEDLYKAFINTVLGKTYAYTSAKIRASALESNIRNYPIGVVPEALSIKQGNGSIVMLTCACDLNGTEDDARLDYEIVGWSESESSYSIRHGSIGTFVPRENEKNRKDREHWTYRHGTERSVWTELDKIRNEMFKTDTGRYMGINVTGIDCGHYSLYAYAYIDKCKTHKVVGVKGDKETQYRKFNLNIPVFKMSKERANLWLLDVNHIKDWVSEYSQLYWTEASGDAQPANMMNFPLPANGLYIYDRYFKHYEAEKRSIEVKEGEGVASRWKKVGSNEQNHFWDVRVYNVALKELWCYLALKASEKKTGNWVDFVQLVKLQVKFGR